MVHLSHLVVAESEDDDEIPHFNDIVTKNLSESRREHTANPTSVSIPCVNPEEVGNKTKDWGRSAVVNFISSENKQPSIIYKVEAYVKLCCEGNERLHTDQLPER